VLGLFGSRYAVPAAFMLGVAKTASLCCPSCCIAHYFGLRCFGEVWGLLCRISAIGLMLGPLAFGYTRDVTGTYVVSIIVTPGGGYQLEGIDAPAPEEPLIMRENLEETVVNIIAQTHGLERATIDRSANLQDIGSDSMSLTAVIAALEAYLQVELNSDEIVALFCAETVGDLVSIVNAAANAAG
jgi:acyl carrier protein